MHGDIVLRLKMPRGAGAALPLGQGSGGLTVHLAVAGGAGAIAPGWGCSVRSLAPLPREGRPPLQRRLLRLGDLALVARAHEFAFAGLAAELAIGGLQIDVAVLGYLAGLRVVVRAAAVEGLRLLVAGAVFVDHVGLSEVLVGKVGADGVEVAATGSLSAGTLTEVLLEASMMHVEGAVVHVLRPLGAVVFFVGAWE